MDRNLRLEPTNPDGRRRWLRAAVIGLAVAGAVIVAGAAAPRAAVAQVSGTSMSVPLAPDAPDRYVVKRGDTLWDIAGVFLRDPWYWPEIWYVNPEIANPHLIYPGDVLNLVYVDGKPRITLEAASPERLSPQVRSEPLTGAIRAIPYDLLMDFVGRPSLLDEDTVKKQPYVIGFRDRHLIGSDHNEIYATGLDHVPVDSRYNIVHVGEELVDPDDGDLLGYIGHYAGTARVIEATKAGKGDEGLTHLMVVQPGREILQGDKLFPAVVDVGADFVPSAPSEMDLDGRVIAVVDGVYSSGRYQVLAINRGRRDGLAPGNAVAVFTGGDLVRNRGTDNRWRKVSATYETVQLPKERSGTLLLFAVHDRVSYGLVVESTQALSRGDYLKHPAYGHRDAGLSTYSR